MCSLCPARPCLVCISTCLFTPRLGVALFPPTAHLMPRWSCVSTVSPPVSAFGFSLCRRTRILTQANRHIWALLPALLAFSIIASIGFLQPCLGMRFAWKWCQIFLKLLQTEACGVFTFLNCLCVTECVTRFSILNPSVKPQQFKRALLLAGGNLPLFWLDIWLKRCKMRPVWHRLKAPIESKQEPCWLICSSSLLKHA